MLHEILKLRWICLELWWEVEKKGEFCNLLVVAAALEAGMVVKAMGVAKEVIVLYVFLNYWIMLLDEVFHLG